MMSSDESQRSAVVEWYSGKNILITGATGFMGKVLVEKLLRSCPDIGNIYILVRAKRGIKPEERLNTIINVPLFDILKKDNPKSLEKIVLVKGDITYEGLGLSNEDRAELAQNVSVVFHCAATVKFDEALKSSYKMNISGTQELVNLAYEMEKLESFIHVSTAYCNCNIKEIDEIIYPPPMELNKLTQCFQCLDDNILEDITPRLLKDRPNTYTFTKALAEHFLLQHQGKLPIAIFRPSIVTASWNEPVPGWVDSLNGPTGVILGASKGILRSAMVARQCQVDIIPVDVVINMMICVAWKTALSRTGTANIPVYNCSSGIVNPITWYQFENLLREHIAEYPVNGVLWYPGGSFKSCYWQHRLSVYMFQKVPAYLIDLVMAIIGRKQIMKKLQKKLNYVLDTLEYFSTNEWIFKSENVPRLLSSLSEADKKTFNFDISELNWNEYMINYHIGIRKYLLKDTMESLPAAKQHLNRMKYLHYTVQGLFVIIFWKIFIQNTGISQFFYQNIYSLFFYIFSSILGIF